MALREDGKQVVRDEKVLKMRKLVIVMKFILADGFG